MHCCPRLSPWWWTKVAIALGLALQAAVVLGLGRGTPLVSLPIIVGQAVILFGAAFSALHYRWIRHPMYLGDFVVIVGFALLCPTVFSALAIPVAVIALVRLADHEDRQLEGQFGERYQTWADRSTRLVPFVL